MARWHFWLLLTGATFLGCGESAESEPVATQTKPATSPSLLASSGSEQQEGKLHDQPQASPSTLQPKVIRPRPAVARRILDASEREQGPLSLDWITPDVFGAVVVHPRQIVMSRSMAPEPFQQMFDDFASSAGVEPENVRQLMFLMAPITRSTPEGEAYMPAAILRFVEPVDGTAILQGMWGAIESAEVNGVAYYRQTEVAGEPTAAFLPDAKTLILASESMVRRMLAEPPRRSPLIDRVATLDVAHDVVAVIDTDMLREAQSVDAGAGQLPPPLAALLDGSRLALITADLESENLARIQLSPRDMAASESLLRSVQQNVEAARMMYSMAKVNATANMPPETKRKLLPLIDRLVSSIRVEQTASGDVTITAPRPEGLDAWLAVVAEQMSGNVGDSAQSQSP